MPSGPAPRRNPFDTAVMPSRPLSERISYPSNRSRSLSPGRNHDGGDSGRKGGLDSYRPGGAGSRSRSPMPSRPREGGRRPGGRRDGGDRGARREGGERGARNGREGGRVRKTQEELDAEMEDYFGPGGAGGKQPTVGDASNGAADAGQEAAGDVDMIE